MPSIENSENDSLMSHPPIASREEWQQLESVVGQGEGGYSRARCPCG